MHLPLLFRTKTQVADSPTALRSLLQRGLTTTTRCRLLTHTRSGQCHARTLRLFGWSLGATPSLWFVTPRQSQLAFAVRTGAEVMVEISDSKLPHALRVDGHAKLVEGRHEPVYLHPSARSASMKIDSDSLDFVFVRVDLRAADEERALERADRLAA